MKNSSTLKARTNRYNHKEETPQALTPEKGRVTNNRKQSQGNQKDWPCVFVVLLAITCFLAFFSRQRHQHIPPTPTATLRSNVHRIEPLPQVVQNVAVDQAKEVPKVDITDLEASAENDDEENEVVEKEEEVDYHEKSETDSSLENVIKQFHEDLGSRYGSSNLQWLDKAAEPFGSLEITAQRMVSKKAKGEPFVIAFAGYSVTVGRGNYFNQSFPFVLQDLLKPVFDKMGLEMIVRNAAIGGIPSFPYGFCLPHFLGMDADVISWDYGLNEGKAPHILESYIRLSQQNLPNRPMLIVLDNNAQRKKLLEEYAAPDDAKHQVLLDGLVLRRGTDILPKSLIEAEEAPPGFMKWDEFGAPNGCPGRSSWHPKQQEHSFLGHVLAKYFVKVVERASELMQETPLKEYVLPTLSHLPPPQSPLAENSLEVSQLLYGHENQEDSSSHWDLQELSCRTSFLPAQDHEKVLPSIVVKGYVEESKENIMKERPDSMYEQGWVLDVSKIERETKKKVERCGGLGYVDMKIALYGIPQSGTLSLWLPYEGKGTGPDDEEVLASDWIHNLILCEANEKRDDDACRLNRDLKLNVGGVDNPHVTMVNGAGVYLNRPTCLSVEVPPAAMLTPKPQDIITSSNSKMGLSVDIQAADSVTRAKGACCISHVVWEQQQPPTNIE